MYIPAINNYMGELASDVTAVKAVIDADTTAQETLLKRLSAGLAAAYDAVDQLEIKHNAAQAVEDAQQRANMYANTVIPAMDALRNIIDDLECITDHDYWPVPTYNDMLFYC